MEDVRFRSYGDIATSQRMLPLHFACNTGNIQLVARMVGVVDDVRGGCGRPRQCASGGTSDGDMLTVRNRSVDGVREVNVQAIQNQKMDASQHPSFDLMQRQSVGEARMPLHDGNDESGDMPMDVDATPLNATQLDVNQLDDNGCTALMLTINDAVLEILLTVPRLDVNRTCDNASRFTALHLAVIRNQPRVVQMLLGREDLNPNTKDSLGRTALHWALLYSRDKIVDLLLSREDIDVNAKMYCFDSLHCSCFAASNEEAYNHVAEFVMFKELLVFDFGPHNPDYRCQVGFTPLAIAASIPGELRLFQTLLKRKDMLVDQVMCDGSTALVTASWFKNTSVVCLLLNNPAININARGWKLGSAFVNALQADETCALAFFNSKASAGLDLCQHSNKLNPYLSKEFNKYFFDRKTFEAIWYSTNLNFDNSITENVLHLAVRLENRHIVQLLVVSPYRLALLGQGQGRTNRGFTPLQLACCLGSNEIVDIFLNGFTAAELKESENNRAASGGVSLWSPVQIACRFNQKIVLKTLLESPKHSFELNPLNRESDTPFALALSVASRDEFETLQMLLRYAAVDFNRELKFLRRQSLSINVIKWLEYVQAMTILVGPQVLSRLRRNPKCFIRILQGQELYRLIGGMLFEQ